MSYSMTLAKENFKFSGTHFTILSPTSAERLHGHNYYVQVEIDFERLEKPELGMSFDFNHVKPIIKKLCDELDEVVLLPGRSKFVNIESQNKQCLVKFRKRTYSFPAEETRILPVANVTSEELARYLAEQLVKSVAKSFRYARMRIKVEESRGQGASFIIENVSK